MSFTRLRFLPRLSFVCSALICQLLWSELVRAESKVKREILPKPVYNFISGERDPLDDKVEGVYRGLTKVLTVSTKNVQFSSPSLQERPPLRTISDGADGIVLGKLSVAAIVDETGGIQAPQLLESSDPRLVAPVLQNIRQSKFTPATLKGKPVASLIVNVYQFPDEPLLDVNYVKAEESLKAGAKERLQQFLSAPSTSTSLSLGATGQANRPTLLGPFLSDHLLRGFAWTSNEKKGNYRWPLSQEPYMQGQMPLVVISKEETSSKFRELWSKVFPDEGTPKIRPLELKELALVWYFVSWSLTEPLFVAETPHRTLVFDLDEKGEHIDWLEDITQPCVTPDPKAIKDSPCFCADIHIQGKKWDLLFKESKLCRDS